VTSAINRYYDPTTGEFISVDPDVAETGQAYAYAGDDPVDGIDPMGLFPGESLLHEIALGFDSFRHQNASAGDWLASQVDGSTCNLLPGPNRGSVAGWLQSQAGCGNDAAAQPESVCSTTQISNSFVGGTLSFLHSASSLRATPEYQHWSQQSTEAILKSLAPGSDDGSLLVNENGTIVDGNTRTLVLQDRGYDIDTLPRSIHEPVDGIPDIPEPLEGL
jgi:hypothetical protein